MRACLIDGCPKPAGVPGTAHGWCSAHYNRWKRTGDPLTTLTDLKPVPPTTCSVEGCDSPRWARGWCATHYRRWQTGRDVGGAERLTKRPQGRCVLTGCRRRSVSGKTGYCGPHYQRWLKHGDPLAGGPTPKPRTTRCAIRSCDRQHYSLGLCNQHWSVIRNRPTIRARRLDRQVVGECTPAQLIARVDYYGGRCWMCGGPADEIDHVKPLSVGGTEWPANLRPACRDCNAAKASRWPYATSRKAA